MTASHNIMFENKKVKNNFMIGAGIFFIIFIFATFYDLQVSQSIANQKNLFSFVIEHFAAVPFALTFIISGAITLATCKKEKDFIGIIKVIGAGLYFILCVAFAGLMVVNYLTLWAIIPTFIVVVLVTMWAWRIQPEDKQTYQRIALICFIVSFGGMMFIENLKPIVGRVRFRSLDATASDFTRWYQINGEKFLPYVSAKEEIKSFPSGHSLWGTTALSLSLLGTVNMSKTDRNIFSKYYFYAMAWALIVMISRVLQGAHYMTDTLFSFGTITLLFVVSTYFILWKPLLKDKA